MCIEVCLTVYFETGYLSLNLELHLDLGWLGSSLLDALASTLPVCLGNRHTLPHLAFLGKQGL